MISDFQIDINGTKSRCHKITIAHQKMILDVWVNERGEIVVQSNRPLSIFPQAANTIHLTNQK